MGFVNRPELFPERLPWFLPIHRAIFPGAVSYRGRRAGSGRSPFRRWPPMKRAASANPLAAKAPLFPARAKRVIFLFMQGGVSQVDSFDYKPRLDQRRRQACCRSTTPAPSPTPARAASSAARHEAAVEVRASTASRGRWASDLFPQIAQHVDDLCFLHSHAHRGRRARPGDAVPALRLDQLHPAVDGLVGALRPGHREREPARLRHASARRRATAARATTATPSCRAVYQGTADRPGRRPRQRGDDPQPHQRRSRRDEQRRQLRPAPRAERRAAQAARPATPSWRPSSTRTSSPGGCRRNAPDVLDLSQGNAGDADALRHRREADRQLRPAVPDGPAARARPACATCRSPTATTPPTPPGTSTRTCPSTPTTPAPSTSRSPGCSPT